MICLAIYPCSVFNLSSFLNPESRHIRIFVNRKAECKELVPTMLHLNPCRRPPLPSTTKKAGESVETGKGAIGVDRMKFVNVFEPPTVPSGESRCTSPIWPTACLRQNDFVSMHVCYVTSFPHCEMTCAAHRYSGKMTSLKRAFMRPLHTFPARAFEIYSEWNYTIEGAPKHLGNDR